MSQTDRFALPLIDTGQAQKDVTHNAAIAAIDALLHPAVGSRTLTTPPASPAPGDAWIVPVGATGVWSAQTGDIAVAEADGWRFLAPRSGMLAWIGDEGLWARFDDGGGAWLADSWPVAALQVGARRLFALPAVTVATPTGGTTVDSQARTALSALVAALRDQGVIA